MMMSHGPLHQIKGDLNLFFSKLSLHGFAANPCHGKALKEIDLNLLLFDVGGPSSLVMAGIQVNFELWPIFCSIYLIPILNLRPGLNSAAFLHR